MLLSPISPNFLFFGPPIASNAVLLASSCLGFITFLIDFISDLISPDSLSFVSLYLFSFGFQFLSFRIICLSSVQDN